MSVSAMTRATATPAKRQQSISNFFSQSTAARTSNAANGKEALPVARETTSLNVAENGAVADQDEAAEPPSKRLRRDESTVTDASCEPVRDAPLSITRKASASDASASGRTSRFLFSSSPNVPNGDAEDEDALVQKQRRHQQFVKRLGYPDSISDIKRRTRSAPDHADEGGAGSDSDNASRGELDTAQPATSRKRSSGATSANRKATATKQTPLEKQVLDIKHQHPDSVLVVEVGYKFRFFGEDARIAARELSIVCIPGKFRFDDHPSERHLDRFASASIPVHRLHVHVKRLVAAGHKVGIVRQLETAALKAIGDNRNAPFERRLTNLYTKGTYVDDVEGLQTASSESGDDASAAGYLLAICESKAKGWGTDEKVQIGIVAVQPATGDVIYDDFEDGFMRSEIETRFLHIRPAELLLVGDLTPATEKMIRHLAGSRTVVLGDRVRIERVPKSKDMTAQAYSHVSSFYAQKIGADDADAASNLFHKALKLAENVTICLSAMIHHLSDYGLEHVFDLTRYFQSFSARSHMLLNSTTLSSLEIFQNQTDYTTQGSLFWALDRTKTRFGQRLLRKWVGRPLLDRVQLELRRDAVRNLKDRAGSAIIQSMQNLLRASKFDLERSLIRIYYGKCTRPELVLVLQQLQRVALEASECTLRARGELSVPLLTDALAQLPMMEAVVVQFLNRINLDAAQKNDKYSFLCEGEESEAITERKLGIASVEFELDAYREAAASAIRRKKIDFVTCAGIEYLIEVDNTQLKNVPASWIKISGTRKLSRFHTPEVIALIRERDQHREALAAACDAAYAGLLREIAAEYQPLRDGVQALAQLDCLLSLAHVAAQPGYIEAELSDVSELNVGAGRHPMVEQRLLEAYVPNDVNLHPTDTRALLITGPNMGGKSSYVRQVALIAIMNQIGSFVPAQTARLGLLDGVFTRMGAFDNMMLGESTFMVELSETADILKQASPRSLVILDELGRGTSTHDGVAIAQAVLNYVVRDLCCLTLFITHYQQLSGLARSFSQHELRNVHMRFREVGESQQEVVFLYEVGEGIAHRSYGLNVARLAQIPEPVISCAWQKSQQMECSLRAKSLHKLAAFMAQLKLSDKGSVHVLDIVNAIETL